MVLLRYAKTRRTTFKINIMGQVAAAIFLSFIATCKANGINPHEYLKDVLARINSHPYRRLAELLPHNWKAVRENQ
jgi:transposase